MIRVIHCFDSAFGTLCFVRRIACVLGLAPFFLLVAPVFGAGTHTHALAAQAAIQHHLKQAGEMLPGLDRFFLNPAVRQACYCGCCFPDWGFPNDINHDAAETAHWQDYQQTYVERLRKNCGPPWNLATRRRVAFFLGMLSHGLMDIPWHFSHHQHKSLLQMAWDIDHANHGDTEFSMEIVSFNDACLDASTPCVKWPFDDILAAYRGIDDTVTQSQLEDGKILVDSSWTGARMASFVMAERYRQKYPWLARGYRDYYYGGVRHGGAVSALAFREVYAYLHGWRCFQQGPDYARKDTAFARYTGCVDATVLENRPDHNTGGEPFLTLAGGAHGDRAVPLLRFDLKEIPVAAPIRNAKLWLYLDCRQSAMPRKTIVEAIALKQPWTVGTQQSDAVEGEEGKVAAPGEATWRRWIETNPLGLPAVSSTSLRCGTAKGRWVAWDVTTAVRRWVGEPAANFGVALRVRDRDSAPDARWRFVASDALRSRADGLGGGERLAYRPLLIVFLEGEDQVGGH